jgi:hypothetical protein
METSYSTEPTMATGGREWYNQLHNKGGFLGEKSIWEAESENGDTYTTCVFFNRPAWLKLIKI